jgi:TolB-like protein
VPQPGFFDELRRRNVPRAAVLYCVSVWLIVQIATQVFPFFEIPSWTVRLIVVIAALGFPFWLAFAWFYGLTSQGPPGTPTPSIGRRLDLWIIGLLLAAVALLVYTRFADGRRATVETARTAGTGTALEATPSAQPSLAVLPFADLSQAHDQEYLGDGLAEEILNQLAQVPTLRLVGRTSSFSFKGKNEDLRTIGGKLGVAHLLEGSVRKDGNQLRVTAQLVRAEDGTHLWSKTYARELRDVFTVQDDIARDVAQALSVKLDAVTLNRAQGGTTNVDAYDRFLRWRQLFLSDSWDAEHDRQRVQLAREAVAFDPKFVLAWDALAISLHGLTGWADGAQAEQLRAEVAQIRARIAQLAPDHWSVKRERAYDLWRQGERAEAIAVAREIMDSGPLTYEHAFPYINLIFAVGHLDETVALVEQLRTIEPLSLFVSRDLQYDYIAARRYDEAEAEYRRSLALEGSHIEPTWVAFLRMLAHKDADLKALRELHRQLVQDFGDRVPPYFRDLGAVLHDRDAMLAILRKAAPDPAYRGGDEFWSLADALGDAALAAAAMRESMEGRQGFKEGHMSYGNYFSLWIAPYSGLRAHPEFKRLLIETGVADYWRQTGKWGDGCKPLGADDFQCQ